GLYRSPFSLPNGEILASYASGTINPATATPRYDLVAVNAQTGARRMLASGGNLSYVEATVGYKRAARLLFSNPPQLVFGGHSGDSGDTATMHFPDVPLLATLLGANLRRGRDVDPLDRATALKIYQEQPPPAPMPGTVYSLRMPLGAAGFEADRSLK